MKKRLEFAYQPINSNYYNPQLIAIDIDDISFTGSINTTLSFLETKNGKRFIVFGKIRTINNRISHIEISDKMLFDDVWVRPSLNIKYKVPYLHLDSITMDAPQLKAIIDAYFQSEGYSELEFEELYKTLQQDTYEQISKIADDFWVIPSQFLEDK